jgi:hypothetical protein
MVILDSSLSHAVFIFGFSCIFNDTNNQVLLAKGKRGKERRGFVKFKVFLLASPGRLSEITVQEYLVF